MVSIVVVHAHAKRCSVLECTNGHVLSDGAYIFASFASSDGTEWARRSQQCEDLINHSISVIMALILPASFRAPRSSKFFIFFPQLAFRLGLTHRIV